MSSEKEKGGFTIDFSRLFSSDYDKAVPGSYDESLYTDPVTGKFRFPSNNTLFKGIISVKDETNYKQEYFSGLSIKEKQAFSIDEFERNFMIPLFSIEKFSDFMERMPEESFEKGISKENVLYLFRKFKHFINEEHFINDEETEPYFILEKVKSDDALRLGLLSAFDITATNSRELWDNLHTNILKEICKANNLTGTNKRAAMLDKILELNPAFPHNVVNASDLLQQTFFSFVDFYLDDIKNTIDQLHPLYLEPVWETVRDTNFGTRFRKRVNELMDSRYWADRLITITTNDEEDEDGE
ncbi:hypothetical protein [Flavitalea sp.]|nr:hypothetical protein [Flavitalea sp.]